MERIIHCPLCHKFEVYELNDVSDFIECFYCERNLSIPLLKEKGYIYPLNKNNTSVIPDAYRKLLLEP